MIQMCYAWEHIRKFERNIHLKKTQNKILEIVILKKNDFMSWAHVCVRCY